MTRRRAAVVTLDPARAFLTLDQAAIRYGFDQSSPHDPANGFRRFALRNGLPLCGRGKVIRVEVAVADEFMRRHPWARRKSA